MYQSTVSCAIADVKGLAFFFGRAKPTCETGNLSLLVMNVLLQEFKGGAAILTSKPTNVTEVYH
jgi:hypothetical protein